jgi:hypothetical protein
MPSLLDRYIHAVQRHLPHAGRHDIAAELRETIQSRMEEDAATHGRDLSEAEQAAILKSVGRPVVVAGRYGSSQYLIGPGLFPYYRSTLKALATIGVPLLLIAMVVGAAAADSPWRGAVSAMGQSLTTALAVFALVTIVFWQMERGARKPELDDDWDPAELPAVPDAGRGVSRAHSIGQAALLAVYLLWWVGVLPLTRLLHLVPTGVMVPQLAPVWQRVFLAIAVLMGVELIIHVWNAWRPQVPRWRVAAQMACDLAGLGLIVFLVNADALVVTPVTGQWVGLGDRLDDITRVGLLGLGVLIAVGLIDEGRRLLGAGPPEVDGGFFPRLGSMLSERSRPMRAVKGMKHFKATLRPPRAR